MKFSRDWSVLRIRKHQVFEKKLFEIGFWIRVAYGIFSYFFYSGMTGKPYEFQAADSIAYIELAQEWSVYWEKGTIWTHLIDYTHYAFSDMGFPLFELLPIHWFGENVTLFLLRILFALIGSSTAVLVYRLVCRSMGDTTARIAAIFCMLHPVLICYVGILLKEVLMTFLLVLFIDLGDRLLRSKKYTFETIAPMSLVGFSLFMFRTVLGMVAIMAVFFAIIMMDSRIVSAGKKIIVGTILAGVIVMTASDNIMREVRKIT